MALIPYAWSVFAVFFINRVHAFIGGIPVLLLWMMAGIIVSSLTMAYVGYLDRKAS
ncbi:MAG: DUF3311 domain-containing protein [Desulfitobacteriaceae bacterium]